MDKEFVPYQQSVEMEELGFNKPCIAFFNTKSDESLCFVDLFGFVVEKTLEDFHINNDESKTSAPTFSQAFKFFRENYNKLGCIKKATDRNRFIYLINDIVFGFYDTYEKAELACLKKLIELVKKQIIPKI